MTRKLSDEQVRTMRGLKENNGLTDKQLGERFGVDRGTVRRAVTNKTYAGVKPVYRRKDAGVQNPRDQAGS
jgi:predicted transcriptional regulator